MPAPRHTRVDDYRVGYWFDEPDCAIASEYRVALGRAADALLAAGARVEASRPDVSFREQVDLWITLSGAANAPGLPVELAEAAGGSHLGWLRKQERRQDLRQIWRAWFDDYDAVLCPVVLSAAHPLRLEGGTLTRTYVVDGEARSLVFEVPRWCGLINVIGFPSCVVPIGRNPDGLPLGMQLVTSYLRDRDAIALARHMQDVVASFEPPPLAV